MSNSLDREKLKTNCFKECCTDNLSVDGRSKDLLLERGKRGIFKTYENGRRHIESSANISQGEKEDDDCIKRKRVADSQKSLL